MAQACPPSNADKSLVYFTLSSNPQWRQDLNIPSLSSLPNDGCPSFLTSATEQQLCQWSIDNVWNWDQSQITGQGIKCSKPVGQLVQEKLEEHIRNSIDAPTFTPIYYTYFKDLAENVGLNDPNFVSANPSGSKKLYPLCTPDLRFDCTKFNELREIYNLSTTSITPITTPNTTNNQYIDIIKRYNDYIGTGTSKTLGQIVRLDLTQLRNLNNLKTKMENFNTNFNTFAGKNQTFIEKATSWLTGTDGQTYQDTERNAELDDIRRILTEQIIQSKVENVTGTENDYLNTIRNYQFLGNDLSQISDDILDQIFHVSNDINTKTKMIQMNNDEVIRTNSTIQIILTGLFVLVILILPLLWLMKQSSNPRLYTIAMGVIIVMWLLYAIYTYTNRDYYLNNKVLNRVADQARKAAGDIYTQENEFLNVLRSYAYEGESEGNCGACTPGSSSLFRNVDSGVGITNSTTGDTYPSPSADDLRKQDLLMNTGRYTISYGDDMRKVDLSPSSTNKNSILQNRSTSYQYGTTAPTSDQTRTYSYNVNPGF